MLSIPYSTPTHCFHRCSLRAFAHLRPLMVLYTSKLWWLQQIYHQYTQLKNVYKISGSFSFSTTSIWKCLVCVTVILNSMTHVMEAVSTFKQKHFYNFKQTTKGKKTKQKWWDFNCTCATCRYVCSKYVQWNQAIPMKNFKSIRAVADSTLSSFLK